MHDEDDTYNVIYIDTIPSLKEAGHKHMHVRCTRKKLENIEQVKASSTGQKESCFDQILMRDATSSQGVNREFRVMREEQKCWR